MQVSNRNSIRQLLPTHQLVSRLKWNSRQNASLPTWDYFQSICVEFIWKILLTLTYVQSFFIEFIWKILLTLAYVQSFFIEFIWKILLTLAYVQSFCGTFNLIKKLSLVEVGNFVEFRRHICFPYDVMECLFLGNSVVLINLTKRVHMHSTYILTGIKLKYIGCNAFYWNKTC